MVCTAHQSKRIMASVLIALGAITLPVQAADLGKYRFRPLEPEEKRKQYQSQGPAFARDMAGQAPPSIRILGQPEINPPYEGQHGGYRFRQSPGSDEMRGADNRLHPEGFSFRPFKKRGNPSDQGGGQGNSNNYSAPPTTPYLTPGYPEGGRR
jgi:hypothetical protein